MATPFDDDNDFGLGEPKSPLRHNLDAHAAAVGRQHNKLTTEQWIDLAEYDIDLALAVVEANPEPLIRKISSDRRMKRVLKAVDGSFDIAVAEIVREFHQPILPIIGGALEKLLTDMAKFVGIGALVGGAVGLLGGPFDEVTVPGGAMLGARVGLWAFNLYGLGQLLNDVANHLDEFIRLSGEGAKMAYYAGETDGFSEERDMRDARRLFAAAIVELWFVILQAIIIWILHRAGKIAGKAVGKIFKGMKRPPALQQAINDANALSTKLGRAFNNWLNENFEKINDFLEQRRRGMIPAQTEQEGRGTSKQQAAEEAKVRAEAAERKAKADELRKQRAEARAAKEKAEAEATAKANQPPPELLKPKAPKGSETAGALPGDRPEANPVKGDLKDGWGPKDDIPPNELANFDGPVKATEYTEGKTLYRVIGADSNPQGAYWSETPPPATEEEWRTTNAVRSEWNGASCVETYTVKANEVIKGWSGDIAPQWDGTPGQYLPGGGNQVYIPASGSQINLQNVEYSPTPWNH